MYVLDMHIQTPSLGVRIRLTSRFLLKKCSFELKYGM